MLENQHAPAPHNLLGLLAEFTGDLSLADKHYRAAYALDPTYKPASRNLERTTTIYYRVWDTNPDYGDRPAEEEITSCLIEYDDRKIGHLKKRSSKNEKN